MYKSEIDQLIRKFIVLSTGLARPCEELSYRRVYFVLVQEGAHHGYVRPESVRANFRPKFPEPKMKNLKNFNLCGRRRRGGGPLAAVPSPAALRAPAAAATAAQIRGGSGTTYAC